MLTKFQPLFKHFLTSLIMLLFGSISLKVPVWAGEIYFNGKILTMDAQNTIAEAFFVDQGRIQAVGSNTDLKPLISWWHRGIDLHGKTVVPGFIEAHGHYPASGLAEVGVDLNSPPIGKISSLEAARVALQQKANELPESRWIYAYGYDETMIEGKRLLTRQELDHISRKHPIFVQHISGHQGMANSKALEVMGYTHTTPDPVGGHFGRDQQGNLNGLLLETASDPIKRTALRFPLLEQLKVIERANQDYLSHGVTTVQSGASPDLLITVLAWLSKLGQIPLRVVAYPMKDNGHLWVKGSLNYTSHEHERFKIGAVKLFVDGSIQAYSGLLKDPYFIAQDPQNPNARGHARTSLEELKKEVLFFHKAGRQLAIHANGDAAIEQVIQAMEYAQDQFPRTDPRHIVIHAQMASQEQLERMLALGLTPSFFNSHIYYWGDRHRKLFLGPERAARLNPLNTAGKIGHRYTLHTDTPIVPIDPMLMLWSATERTTRSGFVLGPKERISRTQALKALSLDAAWQSFLEHDLGSLEIGKYADFVILSDNPLEAQDPRAIKVLKTFIDGKNVYARTP